MSKKHPVVVVTGSSGAGTTFVKSAFEHIFIRENISPLIIEGDSFHLYDRDAMKKEVNKQASLGNNFFSHFGAGANLFGKLAKTFENYGKDGECEKRHYIHSVDDAEYHNKRLNLQLKSGQFTPWEKAGKGTDLLFYEGLHGAVASAGVDIAKNADLKIGVVPNVNLEWIQKIHRDNKQRGYSTQEVVDTILRRMPDYVNYITPQFSQTDINFQRVATVDTSNPFIARYVPSPNESFVVIRFNDLKKHPVDFVYLCNMIQGSFMSRRNTIVVPGGKMSLAMEIILCPIISELVKNSKSL